MMLPAVLPACNSRKAVKGSIVGASAERGHLLRNGLKGDPVETTQKKIVIVGGGISGLSAARALHQQGMTDFVFISSGKINMCGSVCRLRNRSPLGNDENKPAGISFIASIYPHSPKEGT